MPNVSLRYKKVKESPRLCSKTYPKDPEHNKFGSRLLIK